MITSTRVQPDLVTLHRRTLRAVALVVVPDASSAAEDDWLEFERIVYSAIAARPQKLRSQLALFLRVIDFLPCLRYGSRFAGLPEAKRVAFLEALERAPLTLLRRGFWGLRTLVFMGWYARPAAAEAIGYRATPAGWDARRSNERGNGAKSSPPDD